MDIKDFDYKIIFDREHHIVAQTGESVYSDLIFIPRGKVALLSLYNMVTALDIVDDPVTGKKVLASNDCIIVHKLSFGSADIPNIVRTCGDSVDLRRYIAQAQAEQRVFHEPVYQCGNAWSISPCNNYALIPTAGFYMLEIFDLDQVDAYIEYTLLDVADSLAIPEAFKLGYGG